MKKFLAIGIWAVFFILLAAFAFLPELSQDDVCPHDGGWVKIEGSDLSLYPVEGADAYCFKAGHWPTIDYIPEGGFGQDGSCNDGIQFCELSHWAYHLADPTPTDTPEDPTATPTDTPEEPTPTPTDTPEEPTPTPTNPPRNTPTPTKNPPSGW